MRFSIITPSLNNLSWLKLCAASVADQRAVEVEHIVQDACSKDGTGDWLKSHREIRGFIESDQGMYDAVNRGFRRATGDVLAYLNCDEQYLAGTLAEVEHFFETHPDVEVVFGDVVVVETDGGFLCERRVLTPRRVHTRWGGNLSFFTAATFVRRDALHRHSLYFDPAYRAVGDAVWATNLLEAGVRMEVLPRLLSSFTETGKNLGLDRRGLEEFAAYRRSSPPWVRILAPAALLQHKVRRWMAGHYRARSYDYAIYTLDSPTRRKTFHVASSCFRWRRDFDRRGVPQASAPRS